MNSFEIKQTENANTYRVIIYKEGSDDSFGYKCDKAKLYSLYSQLKELFRNDEVI